MFLTCLTLYTLFDSRAVWYCEKSYPKSWQLDPTEGPGRVRKRLKRCHLGLHPRFLHTQFQDKLGRFTNDHGCLLDQIDYHFQNRICQH